MGHREHHRSRFDVTLEEGAVSEWEEVDGGIWLASRRGRKTGTVYGQVMVQQGGFRLALLTIGDHDGDED